MGCGPSRVPGNGVYKNMEELEPGSALKFSREGFKKWRYWNVKSKKHEHSFDETVEHVRFLVTDAIKRQLVSDVPLCTFLSGGLDSSIITLYAANYCKNKNLGNLTTYSVDYKDNDKNFVKTDFQPNSDNYYIDIMKKKLDTNHKVVMLDTPELAKYLVLDFGNVLGYAPTGEWF